MFITEQQLKILSEMPIYQGKLYAYIFIDQWIKHKKYKSFIKYDDFSNFFSRWCVNENFNCVEVILFDDGSQFLLDLNDRVCYVSHYEKGISQQIEIPDI